MKLLRNLFVSCRAGALAVLVALGIAGCSTLEPPRGPGVGVAGTNAIASIDSDTIRAQEFLTIELLEISPPSKIEQTVGEDGTITMPLLSERIVAAGKKVGDLQNFIHGQYVPRYYKRMTVNIKRENRYYFVGGEVRTPSQRVYTGDMTLVRAIKSVGDVTVFADKKRVEILRSNGVKQTVDYRKAIKNPQKYDVPIYPGDTIHVPTSWK